MIMELSDLNDDPEIKEKLENLHESVDKIERILEVAYGGIVSDELHVKDKMNYDLFMAYTLNTLYWMYLRTRGIDPNGTEIKTELARVREYMKKAKNAVERHTLRPTLDKPAAGRFIKHEIGHSDREKDEDASTDEPAKKRKRTT